MPFMSVGTENGHPVEVYYEDHGEGWPVVLLAGWALDGRMWERQLPALVTGGYRVISLDRRGSGRSARPWRGYDYDTLAADLAVVMNELDLREATLVGFTLGAGEAVRYLRTHGSGRVAKAVLVSVLLPFLFRCYDNPEGAIDSATMDHVRAGINDDRLVFLDCWSRHAFRSAKGRPQASEPVRCYVRDMAASTFAQAAAESALAAIQTDLRGDLAAVPVPTLIAHGDCDLVAPLAQSALPTHEAVAGSRLAVFDGAPHALPLTHAAQFNRVLLTFLSLPMPRRSST